MGVQDMPLKEDDVLKSFRMWISCAEIRKSDSKMVKMLMYSRTLIIFAYYFEH